MIDVKHTFISYSREDSEFALRLARDLRSREVHIWLDQLDIPTGERWDRSVERALKTCEYLLIILSPASVNSENVMDEVGFAIDEHIHVIPVLYINCEIPFRLHRLQYINFTTDYNSGLVQLLSSLEVYRTARIHESTKPQEQGLNGIQTTFGLTASEEAIRPTIPRRIPKWFLLCAFSVLLKSSSIDMQSRINTDDHIFLPEIGATALAPFQEDGCLYPGTVLTAEKDKSLFRFDFGQEAWITTNNLYLPRTPSLPELKLNAAVYVRLESRGVWASGQIKEQREGKQLVGLNLSTTCRGDKTHEWATVESMFLQK